ncbi:MAG: thioredoxin family protein [Candidatus Obscuribacterales bacterium]|nr:thioredoxin family protein [Candidatus Obscuribacterales bacterium]
MFKDMLLVFLAALLITAVVNGQPPAVKDTPQTGTSSVTSNGTGGDSPDTFEEAVTSNKDLADEGVAAVGSAAETSDDTFDDDVLKSNVPVLVDFSIQGCEPCRRMAPILDSLAGEYEGRLKIVKLDADLNSKVKERYNVTAFPTFILFNQGKQAARSTGAMPKAELASILDQHALKAGPIEGEKLLD